MATMTRRSGGGGAPLLVVALLLACGVAGVSCGVMRQYNKLERVPILVNNVGPFNNPAEVYPYYDLPFCSPKFQHDHDGALGETLAGDRRRSSLYDLRFGVPIQWQALCHFRLSQDEIRRFIDAINNHYIFEIFVDELPVKGFVGEVELSSHKVDSHVHNESSIYLFTHLDFSVAYNGNTIIACNLTTDPEQRVKLVFGQDIDVEFSYSTQWVETSVPWVDRMEYHQKSAIGDQSDEIHRLSIINSFVLVVLLTAFLAIILMHVLKKDIARYMELDPEDFDESEQNDSGWKRVHGDVFRPPQHVMLFSAIIGNGAQMLVLIVSVLLLSLVGTFYPGNRGAVYTALIVLYFITSFIAGYTATTIFVQLGGSKWASNAVLTACLFAIPFFTVFCFVNSVAISYGSTSALPLSTIVSLFLAWAMLALPLTIGGSVRAKNRKPTFDAPCKTNKAEREIPPTAWYRSAPVQMFIAGFLPFSAIYIELHYIFASVWGHRAYTLFGILSLAFLMLIIVTAFITIALTYFQLAVEDYRWWWRAFLSGASTGVFMYAYAAFYFMYRSEMSGVLQGSFFFGYMLVISYAFSLMLGAVSYWMAQKFVKHIYHNIKIA